MKPSEILRAAKQKLIDVGWTQLTMAINKRLKPCSPELPDAHAFCAVGAILATRDLYPKQAIRYLQKAVQNIDGATIASVSRYNDAYYRTKQDILALYDRAIELAEEAGE